MGGLGKDGDFTRIAIIGVGLIGESIAMAATRRWPSMPITRLDLGGDLAGAAGAELVILAAPILTNNHLLAGLAARLAPGTVVTDAGSTKRATVAAAATLAPLIFIGGHPMAGAARGGPGEAREDLFDGRPWILTPPPNHAPDALARLERFVAGLGAVPHIMTPELHDRFVGAVSHLPQLSASALMHVVGQLAGDAGLELAGAGLHDATRLATSPPDIWRDVAATNADVLRDALDALIATLTGLRDSLESGERIDEVFTSARRWREALDRARGQ
jgi:prephenate dehydrogenase